MVLDNLTFKFWFHVHLHDWFLGEFGLVLRILGQGRWMFRDVMIAYIYIYIIYIYVYLCVCYIIHYKAINIRNIWYITIIHYTMLPLSATYICIDSLFSMLIANPNLLGPRNSIRLHHSHTLQKLGFSRISLSSCGLEISCKGASCFGETLDPPNHRVAIPCNTAKKWGAQWEVNTFFVKTSSPSNIQWTLGSSRSHPCLHQISQRLLLPTLPWQGHRPQLTWLKFPCIFRKIDVLKVGFLDGTGLNSVYTHDFSPCYHLPPCRPSFSHDPSRHSCGTWRAWDGSSSSILFSSGMKRPQVSSVEATPRTIWGRKPNRINRCSTVPVGYSHKSMLQCGLVMLSMQLNFQVLCSISKTKILKHESFTYREIVPETIQLLQLRGA